MQQRQLRLGDVLDDYCPRERRVTNHAVVAMVGPDVKQTRCTTCSSEHEYKHAKVPRQRRKQETPAALYSQVAAGAPKRVAPEPPSETLSDALDEAATAASRVVAPDEQALVAAAQANLAEGDEMEVAAADGGGAPLSGDDGRAAEPEEEEGPVHRPLIVLSLVRAAHEERACRDRHERHHRAQCIVDTKDTKLFEGREE